MSGLEWVRLDTSMPSHDKILDCLDRKGGLEAVAVYVFGLAWTGDHGTDGHIPRRALRVIHGTPKHATILEQTKLWEPVEDGWIVRNWDIYQQSRTQAEAIHRTKRTASAKGNCVRWHGPDCGCWRIVK